MPRNLGSFCPERRAFDPKYEHWRGVGWENRSPSGFFPRHLVNGHLFEWLIDYLSCLNGTVTCLRYDPQTMLLTIHLSVPVTICSAKRIYPRTHAPSILLERRSSLFCTDTVSPQEMGSRRNKARREPISSDSCRRMPSVCSAFFAAM